MHRHDRFLPSRASSAPTFPTLPAVVALGIWALLASSTALAASKLSPQTLAACNAPQFQTLLRTAPQAAPTPSKERAAQAVWLNRQLMRWPDVQAGGKFKLYYSATGQLTAAAGSAVTGSDGALSLDVFDGKVPADLAMRFKYVKPGAVLSVAARDLARLGSLHQQQLLLVQEDEDGHVIRATALQVAGALDDLYASAAGTADLGVSVKPKSTQFKLWAPTAQAVTACQFDTGTGAAVAAYAMRFDKTTGVWRYRHGSKLAARYYTYMVDGFVPGVGIVRNRVTDPYAISLNTDSKRSYIANLSDALLKPAGWDRQAVPQRVKAPMDMTVYELHVRDFSVGDSTVPAEHRGKYLAFTASGSNGMRHLKALADAGMTDVHLLPIFDGATVPESNCVSPSIATPASGDSEAPQAATTATAAQDCYNWGYDPFHFNAPEGSFSTDASDGAKRVIELRQMVMALHAAGLRVGMDVVYNHTTVSGQRERSVLDRIVPGYYQRLDAYGVVERSTCCDNTATENMMMGKLMLDSVDQWATQYKIDSFRFDLMAHQPRAVMETLQARVNKAAGRSVNLIGEGWNFGEIANGARFVQASQLSLNGTGIGTFSDRGRDAVRGGSAGDSGTAQISNQGYINGMVYDRNALSQANAADLLRTADMVRVGLAGSIRDYDMLTYAGEYKTLAAIDYGGQPAGYASQPSEVVNYIENHDNQTLYDINVFKLPLGTSTQDRARVQMLGVAINAFSQGIAYFHAGTDILRSKSMDRNSFDSGDWFNRLDWTYQDNFFGTGVPPKAENGESWSLMKPLLVDPRNRPAPADIALARDMFSDLLKIRSSSTLFRLRTATDIKARLSFPNSGPGQNPVVLVGHLDGRGYAGAGFKEVLYFINVDKMAQDVTLAQEAGKAYQLHPVHAAPGAADARVRNSAAVDTKTGRFSVPARTAVVWVID
jgi:pullulanase